MNVRLCVHICEYICVIMCHNSNNIQDLGGCLILFVFPVHQDKILNTLLLILFPLLHYQKHISFGFLRCFLRK